MQVNAMMTYTLSPVHTDAYYVERARELVRADASISSRSRTRPACSRRSARGHCFRRSSPRPAAIPLQLHSHCQSGLAPEVYEIAMRERAFATATPRSSRSPTARRCPRPRTSRRARARSASRPASTTHALAEVSGYFAWLAEREGKPRGQVANYDPALYEHQVPGGMISNLRSQWQTMKMEHRLPEILEEAAQVRTRPRLPDPRQPVRAVHHHAGGAQRRPGRALQDDSRRSAQVRDGLLRPARGAAGRRVPGAGAHPTTTSVVDRAPAAHLPPALPRLRARARAPARATRTCCSRRSTTGAARAAAKACARVFGSDVAAARADSLPRLASRPETGARALRRHGRDAVRPEAPLCALGPRSAREADDTTHRRHP